MRGEMVHNVVPCLSLPVLSPVEAKALRQWIERSTVRLAAGSAAIPCGKDVYPGWLGQRSP